MGEVIEFIPKAERERVRLIREARAIYDSIFPPADAAGAQKAASASRVINGATIRRSDERLS